MPALFLIVFSFMAAFALLLPSIMFFIENLGASKALATRILACYSMAQFLAGPLLGRVSDRLGRKPTLVIGLALAVSAYAILAFLSSNLAAVFAGLTLAGIAAGSVAVAFAAVSDLTTPENRARGMGMLGAAIGLAFTLGPALGAFLGGGRAAEANIVAPATASVIILLFGLIASRFLPAMLSKASSTRAEGGGRLEGFKALSGRPLLLNLALMMFVFTIALALMEPVMPYLIRDRYDWGPREMGYLFGFAGMVAVIVQGGMVGRLAVRYGEQKLVVVGIMSMAVGLACIAWGPQPWFVVLALAFTSVGGALFNTSTFALASKNAHKEERGLILGAVQSMQSLGRSGGPLVTGNLYQAWAILPFLVGIAAMALSLVWAGLLRLWR